MPHHSSFAFLLVLCEHTAEAISAWDVGRSARYARGVHSASGKNAPHALVDHTALLRPQKLPAAVLGEAVEEDFRPPLSLLCVGDESSVPNPRADAASAGAYRPIEFLAFDVNHTSAPASIAGAGPGHAEVKKPLHHSWFAFTLSIALVVKFSCMMSNVIFAVSPFPQVRDFSKQGHTGYVDPAPFISIFYGGSQWCFYGLFAFIETKKSGFLVLIYSNCLGAVLGCYYLWGFTRNCKSAWALLKLKRYWQAVAVVVSCQFLAILALSRRKALLLCGLASSVCSVVGACSLLATLPVVLETKCSASINFPLTVIGFFSSALWLVCGFMLWDAWIILPNIGCLALNTCTMAMVMYFPQDPDEARALRQESESICAQQQQQAATVSPGVLDGDDEAAMAYLMQPSLERHASAESLHCSRPATPPGVHAAGGTRGFGACSIPSSKTCSPEMAVRSPVPVAVVPQYGSTSSSQTALARFWQALPVDLQTRLSSTSNSKTAKETDEPSASCGETGGTM